MTSRAEPDAGGTIESLYPFLYSEGGDLEAVLAEVRQSTVDKVEEVIALRQAVLRDQWDRLRGCATDMAAAFAEGGRLFVFGNGGSSTDAQDLASLFLCPPDGRRPLPAFGLTNDIAVVTALSNDVGFDVVFARQIGAFGRAGDVAIGLSTSGNSANLLGAFDEAARQGMVTVGISGYEGGKMAELDSIDHFFVIPSPSVHRIQEAQTTLYHAIWELTLDRLRDGGSVDQNEGAVR